MSVLWLWLVHPERHQRITSLLVNSLADSLGHIVEEGGIRKFQSQSPGVDFWWYGIKVSRPGQFFLNVKTQHSVCRGSSKGLT